jgi:hypothetical protein
MKSERGRDATRELRVNEPWLLDLALRPFETLPEGFVMYLDKRDAEVPAVWVVVLRGAGRGLAGSRTRPITTAGARTRSFASVAPARAIAAGT